MPGITSTRDSDLFIEDRLCQQLSVKGCVSVKELTGFRPFVIEMKVMLPGKAYAAVNLNTSIPNLSTSIGTIGFGHGKGTPGIGIAFIERPCRIIGRGP